MLTFSLQSGSCGNAIYVEAGDARLIFDAGISGKKAEARMAAHGREIRDCTGLIISHDHSDHTSCAGIYQRKFGLPIYITKKAFQRIAPYAGKVQDVRHFVPGEVLTFGDVEVQTIRTPHDATDAVCFIVTHGDKRLGIFTDLGHPFPALEEAVGCVDAMYLESNYDPEMLEMGPYPWHLKQRIAGGRGHISNEEAATLTDKCRSHKLKWMAASHLSGENNCPKLAVDVHQRRIGKYLAVHLAYRDGPSDILEL